MNNVEIRLILHDPEKHKLDHERKPFCVEWVANFYNPVFKKRTLLNRVKFSCSLHLHWKKDY